MAKFKTCGNIFGQTPEDMEEMHSVMSAAGYEFAYITPQSATLIKEIQTEGETQNGSEEGLGGESEAEES
jgi:mevalonate pyrophosphate decarboxylase